MAEFQGISVLACPDPHVEVWYLSDLETFKTVVGTRPSVASNKCERDYYKRVLASAVMAGGNPPTLGGIEFAKDLADSMDLFRAGRESTSLKHFIEEVRNVFRRAKKPGGGSMH